MASGGLIEFDIRTPADGDTLVRQVEHALSLGLPELRDFEYPWQGKLTIVASGPSARFAPLGGKTLAVNGALKLFTDQGLAPTYWAACDPQEMVVDFLAEAPKETTYLIASKCHPAVFERLKDHNVVVWHVHDEATWALLEHRAPVATMVSITCVSFELMARLGWRDFDVWGWDGCVMDGLENAHPQVNAGERKNILLGDLMYQSSCVWALEAQNALLGLRGFPFPIHIHGGGMFGAILKLAMPTRIKIDPS